MNFRWTEEDEISWAQVKSSVCSKTYLQHADTISPVFSVYASERKHSLTATPILHDISTSWYEEALHIHASFDWSRCKQKITEDHFKTLPKSQKTLLKKEFPTLDLHGDTEDSAFHRLQKFIHEAYASHRKKILVIIGKGSKGEKGVLAQNVPRWLHLKIFAPCVSHFSFAEPHQGGEGALFIFLKKKK